ncbi:unnamed protein product [Discosporangium mesarthrocarpum]
MTSQSSINIDVICEPLSKRPVGDIQQILRILGDAFHDNVVFTTLVPNVSTRRSFLSFLFARRMELIGEAAHAILDRGTGEVIGHIGFAPPKPDQQDGVHTSFCTMMLMGLWRVPFMIGWEMTVKFTGFVGCIDRATSEVIAKYPDLQGGFWSLSAAAVDNKAQGQGFGGAAIRQLLERADRDGRPTVLATQEMRTVRLYERIGFVVLDRRSVKVGDVDLGFETWVMGRWLRGEVPHQVLAAQG